MFNICNEIINIYSDKKIEQFALPQEQNIPEKSAPEKYVMEKRAITQAQIKTKLITSYEEDYTRNNSEIMKLWQRN